MREHVRERYAAAAVQVTSTDPGAGCCAPSETFDVAARFSAPRSTRWVIVNSYPTQILEATLGLTTFEFATRYLSREGLLPGFVAGYSKIHHDEHRHIAYGTWFLRQAVAETPAMGDVVR